MKIIKKDITYNSRSEKFNLIPLGDIHLGNAGCDVKKLNDMIKWIKETPRTYWIGIGDMVDCINPLDPRFDPYSVSPKYGDVKNISKLISMQIQDIVEILKPIQQKGIAFVTGNHEEAIRKFGFDVGYEIERRLEIPCLGYDGWIWLRFIRLLTTKNKSTHLIYTIYISHGYGSARKSGAKINRLEDYASFMDADLIIIGHEHKKIIAPPVLKLGLNHTGELTYRKQIAVMAGSFLKGYVENHTTYVEKKGYAPCDIGVVKIMLKPDVKDIHVSL